MPVSVPSVSSSSQKLVVRRLGHLAGVLFLGALVTACGSDTTKDSGTIAWSQPGASTAGAPSLTPSGPPLNWETRLSGDTITVELRDPNAYYRVERVEMVGPNGLTVAANEIDRETHQGDYAGGGYGYGGGPSVGVGVGSWSGGRRSGTGVGLGLGFPLGGSSYEPPPQPVGTVTRARLRIPDPAFYRQTAANWIIRVTTTDRNNQQNVAVIPAPKPAG
jgi:hypothetical protein